MMVQEQRGLGSPQRLDIGGSFPALPGSVTTSLLGNQSAQTPSLGALFENISTTWAKLLIEAQPAYKLALIKQQKFTPEGKQQRVAASLAALHATQSINLSLAEWKEIVEEPEEGED